ncbi:LysR family transcriptional regulator [uncultured Castellaniella sp.]|uniref:LysR family transcriptional regulator n=1 Tax=uncultured Castellaniella sp. TaxID=647907 RepID=UPI002603FE14|nr:LysR family transcriptional regulator [uncultured Castellaniella sp.]
MNAESLVFLADILDAGNLSAAARRLKMTRANVSYHLSRLEQALGQQLVRRTTRRTEATEVGLRLYEHGCRIRTELAIAQDSVRELGQQLRGRLRLSIPSGFGQTVMGPWLLDFKRQYPGIVLDVTFENHLPDMLRDETDISVRVMSNPPQNLVARSLGPVRHIACASRGYVAEHGLPDTLEGLPRAPIITSGVADRQLRLSAYRDQRRQEVLLEPTLMSENFQFLHQAILAGLGVGIVPDYLVRDEIERGAIQTALDGWQLSIFGAEMFMLYMPNRYHTRATSTFIEYILTRAQGRMPAS